MQRSKRRRQIGTLRARGFPAQSVGRSFAIEAGYVALQGTVTGVLLALLATVAPALSATRIRPAVALRMTD
jgi:ABC-type lipoprotein release transport system permease subunit